MSLQNRPVTFRFKNQPVNVSLEKLWPVDQEERWNPRRWDGAVVDLINRVRFSEICNPNGETKAPLHSIALMKRMPATAGTYQQAYDYYQQRQRAGMADGVSRNGGRMSKSKRPFVMAQSAERQQLLRWNNITLSDHEQADLVCVLVNEDR